MYISASQSKCYNQHVHKSEESSVAPVIKEFPPLCETEEEVGQVDQAGEDAHHPHRCGNLTKVLNKTSFPLLASQDTP